MHISDEGSRLDLNTAMADYQAGWHVYTCGAERYKNSVPEATRKAGFPEEAMHLEYFSVPEMPAYENHEFTIKLLKSSKFFTVPVAKSIAEVLNDNGVPVDMKCSDGICGVCKCGFISGEVEHRDFVLSRAQRKTDFILCQFRAANKGGVIEIDLERTSAIFKANLLAKRSR